MNSAARDRCESYRRRRGRASQRKRGSRCGGTILDVTITDTSPDAQMVQLEIQRSMTGEQRLQLAMEMSEFARELARAGIRHDHPQWSDTQVARELLRLAFLPDPLPPGLP